MRRIFFQLPGLLITMALVLSACNLPGRRAAPETSTASPVAAVEATATQTLPAEVIPTGTPTLTPTQTRIPKPSATSTPEPPAAEVVRESNCRTGPGGIYKLVATYQVGQLLDVVARDLGGGYWFVQNPEKPEEQCFLLAQNIRISGETTALPKYTPPPSPTAPPYFNLSFKKFDTCEGVDFAVFTVENVGSVPFRSAYIKVTNYKANKSVEQALNAFDLKVRCVLAKNIAPLNPGGTGYVYSPPFKWSGRGQTLRAVIMICTEKNLKGTCVTQNMDIKE
ncbi:MAG: hypothetical protein WCC12_04780 [Anaerolineales bacterium]